MREISTQRSLASVTLGFELVVVFFFTLAAFGLELVPRALAFPLGIGLCAIMLAAILLLRTRFGYPLGWAIQVAVFACGFVHPSMFVVALVFGGMWTFAMVKGKKLDRERAAHSIVEE